MNASFTIDVRLPGMNDIIGAANYHRMAGASLKKKWTKTCAQYALVMPKFDAPVRVVIDWIENDYRRDRDNIIGGTKFILDGLVLAGRLPNDTARWVKEITHRFPSPEKGKARVLVYLETMGGLDEAQRGEAQGRSPEEGTPS